MCTCTCESTVNICVKRMRGLRYIWQDPAGRLRRVGVIHMPRSVTSDINARPKICQPKQSHLQFSAARAVCGDLNVKYIHQPQKNNTIFNYTELCTEETVWRRSLKSTTAEFTKMYKHYYFDIPLKQSILVSHFFVSNDFSLCILPVRIFPKKSDVVLKITKTLSLRWWFLEHCCCCFFFKVWRYCDRREL